VALEATKLTAAFLTEKLGSNSSPEAQKQAAYELRLLAKGGTDNRICIADAGAIPLLVPLLSSMDPKTQENAVTALLNLSICECNKMPIVECGASEPIIEVLKNGSTMQSRENAAATVFSLAVNDDLKVVIGNTPDAIPALVTLLREGTASRGKRDATTALYNLALYKGNQASIVRAGVVPLLVSLLLTTDQDQEQEQETTVIIEEALALLALLAETAEGVTAITDACAIPILVKLLRFASSKAKEHAIVVLLSLCKIGGDAVIKTVVKSSSVVPSTYNLFTMGSTPRVKRKAGSLLRLLYNWKSVSDKAPAAVH
jgi:precorrin isomerase